jgi:hypothetical protein
MRKWSIVAAGLLGVALVAVGAPVIAQAAEIRQILVNNNYDETNPGIIEISIDTDEPVAAIHADFIDHETAQIDGAADNFVLTEQTGTWLRYVTSSPVVMDPGGYDVQVAITDADGVVTRHVGDSIRYDVVATVRDVTVDRPVIDWDNRDVTVTGVLQGRWPGTGEVRPIGGAVVGFWVHMAGDDPIVTAADGTFRRTFAMSGALNTIELWYDSGSAHTRRGGSAHYTVTVAPQETRVSMRADRRRAVVGDPITVSGKVERRSANGWVPVSALADLWIDHGCDDTGCAFGFNDVEISADGTFRAQTVARRTGYFKVTVIGTLQFFSSSTAQTRVVTVRPAL